MGIVLPDGVLNNPKLQKVRDFVESKAKIINITSIPQDVFIASGAMVKPSLLFFKKFTLEEALIYEKANNLAITDVNKKFEKQKVNIEKQLADKKIEKNIKLDLKKVYNRLLKEIEDETKISIKENFNYEIPIVEVKKAGISSTGAPIENELVSIAKEFSRYRKDKNLWNNLFPKIRYGIFNGEFQRIIMDEKPHVFYKK